MKKLSVFAALVAVAIPALADYQIQFLTYNGGLSNPVFDVDGTTKVGNTFSGQLYTGTSAGSLTAIGTPQAFLSGGGAGFIEVGSALNITSGTIGGGTAGFYQLRVWNTSSGANFEAAAATAGAKVGSSAVTAVAFGGTPLGGGIAVLVPQANLHSSFQLSTVAAVPEPATLALGLFGAAGLFIRRRK